MLGPLRRLPSAPRAFLLLGATLGVALLLASPPFRWGDENTHFRQALRISEGDLGPACSAGDLNSSVPVGITQFIFFTSLLHQHSPTISWHDILALRGIEMRREQRVAAKIDGAPYTPVPYASQALAIAAAELGTRSALALLFAARLGNFLGWLGLTWLAVRIAPGFGWSFCVLALSPLSVFLATVCSVDASVNALALLWAAYVLRVAARPEAGINRREVIVLAALAVALSLSKFVYGLMIPLALLIPARRAGGRRRLFGLVAFLLAVSSGAVLAWLRLSGRDCLGGAAITSPASVEAQWRSLTVDPWYFVGLLRQAAVSQWNVLLLMLTSTKWGLPVVSRTPSRLLLAAIVLAIVCDDPFPGRLSLARRGVALAVATVGFVAVVLVAFVYWTPPNAHTVRGMQTRYVLPLLPTLLVVLKPPALRLPEGARQVGRYAAGLLAAVILLGTVRQGLAIFTPGDSFRLSARPRDSKPVALIRRCV